MCVVFDKKTRLSANNIILSHSEAVTTELTIRREAGVVAFSAVADGAAAVEGDNESERGTDRSTFSATASDAEGNSGSSAPWETTLKYQILIASLFLPSL